MILVHGFFGFDRIGVPGVKLHYFRGIVKHLEAQGCHAHAVRLPPAASVPGCTVGTSARAAYSAACLAADDPTVW